MMTGPSLIAPPPQSSLVTTNLTCPAFSEPGEPRPDSLEKKNPIPKKRSEADRIIMQLQQVAVPQGQDNTIVSNRKQAVLTEQSYYPCRTKYDCPNVQQARALKRLMASLSLERQIQTHIEGEELKIRACESATDTAKAISICG